MNVQLPHSCIKPFGITGIPNIQPQSTTEGIQADFARLAGDIAQLIQDIRTNYGHVIDIDEIMSREVRRRLEEKDE